MSDETRDPDKVGTMSDELARRRAQDREALRQNLAEKLYACDWDGDDLSPESRSIIGDVVKVVMPVVDELREKAEHLSSLLATAEDQRLRHNKVMTQAGRDIHGLKRELATAREELAKSEREIQRLSKGWEAATDELDAIRDAMDGFDLADGDSGEPSGTLVEHVSALMAMRVELAGWKSGRRQRVLPVIESVPDGLQYAAKLARAQGTEGGEEHDRLLREAAMRMKTLNDVARRLLAERQSGSGVSSPEPTPRAAWSPGVGSKVAKDSTDEIGTVTYLYEGGAIRVSWPFSGYTCELLSDLRPVLALPDGTIPSAVPLPEEEQT